MDNKWLHSVRDKNILEISLVRDGKHLIGLCFNPYLISEFSPNHCVFFTPQAKYERSIKI